ncbi:hypothetical protein ACFFX0_29565 [Citricoccus parietis]|uniref:Uncharacterized protein n=1 Tax=Citricoccus parietis TaxID=592307 RepID=A0ABV5G814_9MICC
MARATRGASAISLTCPSRTWTLPLRSSIRPGRVWTLPCSEVTWPSRRSMRLRRRRCPVQSPVAKASAATTRTRAMMTRTSSTGMSSSLRGRAPAPASAWVVR